MNSPRSIAIYRLPMQHECVVITSDDVPDEYSDIKSIGSSRGGFAIAPFAIAPGNPLLVIKPQCIYRYSYCSDIPKEISTAIDNCCRDNSRDDGKCDDKNSERDLYAADFREFHDMLRSRVFSKIVLARSSMADIEGCKTAMEMFREAQKLYPRTFVSLFSTPRSGTWLVATPETILEGDSHNWHTMALAGTMKAKGVENTPEAIWSEKDSREQEYVSRYIHRTLSEENINPKVEGPRTARAGNLLHLRTDFHFETGCSHITPLLGKLHPTPAVCGLPKLHTYDFIIDNEHCDREYYSGFCGPWEIGTETHLYVTLRCMKIMAGKARLFAGGGLLKESVEQKEWDETEAKMDAMRNICRKN